MFRQLLGFDLQRADSDILQQIMDKDIKTNEELLEILSKMKTMNYFNQFIEQYLQGSKHDQLMKLCSHLKMEKYNGGDIIFQEGDPSNNKLYIIYKGACLLIRKKSMEQLQEQDNFPSPPPKTPPRSHRPQQLSQSEVKPTDSSVKRGGVFSKKFTNQIVQLQTEKVISDQQEQKLLNLYGQPFKNLKKGEGFGDKALIQNQKRALTVAAHSQSVYLVILLKEDFQMISKHIERELKEKQELIFHIFRNVTGEYSSTRLEAMIYSFETIEYEKNTVLTVEEEKGSVFYILQSGEVTLSRYCKDASFTQNLSQVNRNRNIPICLIVSGNLLGEEIVIKKTKMYDHTAVVTSHTAKLMVIDANQFHNKFPIDCKEQIIQDYRIKLANRQKTFLKGIQNRRDNLTKIITLKDTEIDLDAFSQLYAPKKKMGDLLKKCVTTKNSPNAAQSQHKSPFSGRIFQSSFQQQQPITPHNFNTNLSPTVGNYCIQQIVNMQNETYMKKRPNKIFQSQTIEPYDFGKHELEDARQKQYIYEIKNNIVKAFPKYDGRDQSLLTNVIKNKFLKSMHSKHKIKDRQFMLISTQRIFSCPSIDNVRFLTEKSTDNYFTGNTKSLKH